MMTRFAAVFAACLLAAPAQAELFLWEVRSMTNSAWLFGTIHGGNKDWFPLAPAVEQALAESDIVVVEADVTNVEALSKSVAAMAYTAPDELAKHVDPKDYERFRFHAARLRVPESTVKGLKPFTAVSILMFAEWERQGLQPEYSIDAYVIAKARALKKTVVELEGVEAQSAIMDSLTEAEHRTAFAGTLTALDEGLIGEQIEGMVKAWQLGDAFLMLELSRRYNEKIPGARAMEEKFIWSRHPAMLEKIEGYLNKSPKRHFIAVGALHLSGKRGLVELLKSKGYVVRQK